MLRTATALGNYCHNNEEGFAMVASHGIKFPAPATIVAAEGEKDVEKNKATIAEIAAMLNISWLHMQSDS